MTHERWPGLGKLQISMAEHRLLPGPDRARRWKADFNSLGGCGEGTLSPYHDLSSVLRGLHQCPNTSLALTGLPEATTLPPMGPPSCNLSLAAMEKDVFLHRV